MAHLRETSSCGIRELHGLSSRPKDDLRAVVGGRRYGHLFFSDNTNTGNGQRLAETIVNFGLGPIAESVPNRNPQTGNTIIGWVWTPDYPSIQKFLDDGLRPLTTAIKARGVARSKIRRSAR